MALHAFAWKQWSVPRVKTRVSRMWARWCCGNSDSILSRFNLGWHRLLTGKESCSASPYTLVEKMASCRRILAIADLATIRRHDKIMETHSFCQHDAIPWYCCGHDCSKEAYDWLSPVYVIGLVLVTTASMVSKKEQGAIYWFTFSPFLSSSLFLFTS